MARKLLELNTEDGGTILVAVELPEASVGRVSPTGELPIEKVEANFDAVKELIVRGCRPITKAFRTLQEESQPVSGEGKFYRQRLGLCSRIHWAGITEGENNLETGTRRKQVLTLPDLKVRGF
ncbi:MAG: hypothetical protein V7L11_14270 [Nostoc sp.]|uniref:hypothetical protein n=1 Tax=Nostoc sp. TaxID=1180 RepID=UPI002FF45B3F